ncbi:hypothetical protein Tco_0133997 [Tanacetum coccineum]
MNSIWKFWFKFGFGPLCGHLEFVRDFGFGYDLGHHSSFRHCRGVTDWIYVRGVPLLLAFACSRFGALVMGGNDERVDELNGQGNDQGLGANGNVEGVNGGVGGAPDFSTIIAQQLQNLLPAILAQVGNQGNVGNQNGNVVNENVQENVRNVLVNGNRIKKMESVQDMSGCSIDQKVKYTAGSFVEEFCLSHEMQKLETEMWNHVMVGAGHAAYTIARFLSLLDRRMVVEKEETWGTKQGIRIGRDDNKGTRLGIAFATTIKPVGRENQGALPQDCRVVPRNVNPVNVRNPTPARGACYECGSMTFKLHVLDE